MSDNPDRLGFMGEVEKFIPLIVVGAFILGIFIASISAGFANIIYYAITGFIDLYAIFAPIAIFAIVAPALGRVLHMRRGGEFGAYVVGWLITRKAMACIFAVVFTAIIFGFPILPEGSTNFSGALIESGGTVLHTALTSPYFYALYAAIIAAFLSTRYDRLYRGLEKTIVGVEIAGKYFEPIVPLFMLSVGAYLYALPSHIGSVVNSTDVSAHLGNADILGLSVLTNTPTGMIMTYVLGSLIVALACFIWLFAWSGWVKKKTKDFSIKSYFQNYWIRVYPLLWATSSEALSTPLNLYLVKKHLPNIRDEVRRFVVGVGSYLSIAGTVICIFVLAGLIATVLHTPLSLLGLLMAVPVVFLLSFGVPGIPGELVIFAGPMAAVVGLPESAIPAFIALYLGLQLGLPDSFRTGLNSTDDTLFACLINEEYSKKFGGKPRGDTSA